MIQILLIFNDWASLLLRVTFGIIFLVHGWSKIKNLRETGQNFEMMGFKPGSLWGTGIAIIEFFGGLFLIAGLFTSITALILAFEMIVTTIWKIIRRQKLIGGYELDLALLVSLLVLATIGGGIYSLDTYWGILLI